ncbi:MAG: GFA family protein [Alphaproteobacteria bacterium]
MSDTYQGGCFCGEVKFEVSGTPASEDYCHCNDCRNWSAAPFTTFSLWATDAVKFTSGEAGRRQLFQVRAVGAEILHCLRRQFDGRPPRHESDR